MKWLKSEIEFIQSNYLTLSNEEIANQLGRTESSVVHKIGRLRLIRPQLSDSLKHDFLDKWSSHMAYILGFTIADGCIYDEFRFGYGVNIKDRCVLEYISNCFFGHTEFIKDKFEITPKGQSTISRLRVNSKNLVRQFVNRGILPRKTGYEQLCDIPDKYKGDYLRGLFDGDGCIYVCNKKTGQLAFKITSASCQFLEDVKDKLGLGYGYIRQRKNERYYDWKVYTQTHIKKIGQLMYSGACPFTLLRKKERFNYD